MSNPYIPQWFEIPAADLSRAMSFYSVTLSVPLEAREFAGNQIAVFPREQPGEPSGCLIQGEGHSPSPDGITIYFASRPDLAIPLQRVEGAGGQVLVPKTPIGPEMGFFALFEDTEGNHVGLFSPE